MKEGTEPPHALRRTRIVCVSDTHGRTPHLPRGDVLIHAGDLSNQGSYPELRRAAEWIERAEFEAKVVVAGNHDITLDQPFYARHGPRFHNQNPQDPAACLALFTSSSSSITYLNHSTADIVLRSPAGPRTRFRVFGSPYSPAHGLWAFGYDDVDTTTVEDGARSLWDVIPDDTDIVVTHTPPRGHCDRGLGGVGEGIEDQGERRGCEALTKTLWRVRPRLMVCGHVHEGRGARRVRWRSSGSSSGGGSGGRMERPSTKDEEDGEGNGLRESLTLEESVENWIDPGAGNNKLSLVDLTGRKGRWEVDVGNLETTGGESHTTEGESQFRFNIEAPELRSVNERRHNANNNDNDDDDDDEGDDNKKNENDEGIDKSVLRAQPIEALQPTGPSNKGPKGSRNDPFKLKTILTTPQSSDVAAQFGSTTQRETCIVNAAIMPTSWHSRGSSKANNQQLTLNKPIVVDVALPVCVDDDVGFCGG